MLDDVNYIKQFDCSDALSAAAAQTMQMNLDINVSNAQAITDIRSIENIVISSIGGSALSAALVKAWLKNSISVPIEIIRTYDAPLYVNERSLVIANSYSGNTEETISFLQQVESRAAKVTILATGGKLIDLATEKNYPFILVQPSSQPRMAIISQFCNIVKILEAYGFVGKEKLQEVVNLRGWLGFETAKWAIDVPIRNNLAKKIAMRSAGKTAIFYGGNISAPVAYKWKISWNEMAKNTAFWNELPEANHNEFIGWTSHPVEKPFAVFDIVSSLENPQILKRFEVTDRLLGGLRPNSMVINLAGETEIQQLLWGVVLADFASVYLAVLNGIDPTPVELVAKLKAELN